MTVLVHGVNDRLDHLAFGGLAHVEHGGDDAYAEFAEFALGDGGVDAVSEDAVEVVDDDVVDVALGFDPGNHLLEDGPLVDAGCRAARLDKLIDDFRLEFIGFTLTRLTLGRNRDPFRVVVGVDLARGRHAEVEHSPLDCARSASRFPDLSVCCSHMLSPQAARPQVTGCLAGALRK